MLIVLIHNDGTGTEECGNYTWEVRVNTDTLALGYIRGFKRSRGWEELIKEVAKNRSFDFRGDEGLPGSI